MRQGPAPLGMPALCVGPPRGGERPPPTRYLRQVVLVDGGGQNRAMYDAPVVHPHESYGGVGASYASTVPPAKASPAVPNDSTASVSRSSFIFRIVVPG